MKYVSTVGQYCLFVSHINILISLTVIVLTDTTNFVDVHLIEYLELTVTSKRKKTIFTLKEEFEDTKGVIRICKSKRTDNTMVKNKGQKDKQRSTDSW
jgi:hypothetical protein